MAEHKPQLPKDLRHELWTIYRHAKAMTQAIEKLVGREQLDAEASTPKKD